MDLTSISINNQYKIIKEIAEGRSSNLYLAETTAKDNKPVVIKFLKNNVTSNRIDDIIRFRSEVNSISKIKNDNIVKIYDVGEIIKQHYMVMEYIDGKNLKEIIKNKTIPIDETINIIIQICKALIDIHENRIIHKDIKPSNILISNDLAKLTDFGMFHIKEYNDTLIQDDINEIFGYISPEQSGITNGRIDERSDLYSLGIVFYQLLTHQLPFTGTDICSITHQHIALVPATPNNLNPQVPEILSKIVMKLIEKEPDNRYQSAKGFLSDLEKYLTDQKEFILGIDDKIIKLRYRTKLIGRENELNNLKEIFDNAQNGQGALCLIEGEAGSGKKRLVEEFSNYIYSKEGLIIKGGCSIQNKSTPYTPIINALNSYVRNYNTYQESRKQKIIQEINSDYNDFGEILIKLNPKLSEIIKDYPELDPLDQLGENKRFYMATSQFLQGLSKIENKLVIVLDDLQWTDDGTIKLLIEIAENIQKYPLVIIGLFRGNEIQEDHSLHNLITNCNENNINLNTIHLDPFNQETCNYFISSLLFENESNTREISEFIYAKSTGNPFFTITILRELIEGTILIYKDNQWIIDHDKLSNTEISSSIVEILIKRIQLLDKDEKDILRFAAVIGKEFNPELLYKLSDLDTTKIVNIIDKAISLHLLEDDKKDNISFSHNRIKEAFYKDIDNEDKKKIHRLIAKTMEEMERDDIEKIIFDLAYHLIEGGDKERSIGYAFPAGLKAKENYANNDAIKYFKKTIEFIEEYDFTGNKLWIDSKKELGEIYLINGNYNKAIKQFNEILPLLKENIDKSKILNKMCDAYWHKGEWDNCEKYGEMGLSLLGETLPNTKFKIILGIIKGFMVHILHILLPVFFVRSSKNSNNEKYKLIVRIYEFLNMSYALNEPIKIVRSIFRTLNLSERHIGPSEELTKSIYNFAVILMAAPMFKKGQKYNQKGLDLATELGYEWSKARILQIFGYNYEWQANFTKAIDYFNQSYEIFKKLGDIKEQGMVLNGLEHCYYYSSDYANAKINNDLYYKIANKTNDKYFIGSAELYYSQYYRETGDLQQADYYAQKSNNFCFNNEIWLNYCTSLIELGANAIEKGEPANAISFLRKVKKLLDKNNFLKAYLIPVYFNISKAYIDDFKKNEPRFTPKLKNQNLKKIKKSIKQALKKTKNWSTHYGSALRVAAEYYALIGKNKKAEKYYLDSINLCKKTDRRYELALSNYYFGLFLSQTSNTEKSLKCFESAYHIFSEINSQLYIDRLNSLLGIKMDSRESSIERLLDKERTKSLNILTKNISMIKNIDDILDQVISNSVELTGAQRGYLFIFDETNFNLEIKASKTNTDSDLQEYSNKIINEVYNEGNYILTTNNENNGLIDESQTGIKSILSIPIKSRYRTIGVCYLDNSLSSGIFTDKEVKLLHIYMLQAGEAIENAYLHQKLQSSTTQAISKTITDLTEEKIKQAMDYIQDHYTFDISREGLAAHLDISPDHLGKKFKVYTGKKINEYIYDLRIQDAVKKLENTDNSIINIAFSVGFDSLSTFSRAFYKIMKTTPTKFREMSQ